MKSQHEIHIIITGNHSPFPFRPPSSFLLSLVFQESMPNLCIPKVLTGYYLFQKVDSLKNVNFQKTKTGP